MLRIKKHNYYKWLLPFTTGYLPSFPRSIEANSKKQVAFSE